MIAFQSDLRPAIPNVYGAADYCEFRDHLNHIDRVLLSSGVEHAMVSAAMQRWENGALEQGIRVTPADRQRQWSKLGYAFRCNVARHLMGESYRDFSIRLADSALLQWFTGINELTHRRAASKSSLDRYDKFFELEEIEMAVEALNSQVFSEHSVAELIGQQKPLSIEEVFADCTCVKANIHFPTDWVLLRDAARTLIAAIKLIRDEGLKHRMPEPSSLMKRMNRLCIEMTHARRQKDSRKTRKRVLRAMKKLSRTIEQHGHRYRAMLAQNWEQTEWTQAQSALVLGRLDNVLEKLPGAIRQAHERIIGERQMQNKDKMLSLYEEDVHVLVRGKSGAEVEFGNGLYLVEQQDGLIVDWTLLKDQPPADTRLVRQSVERIEEAYGPIQAYSADRGFDCKANRELLEEQEVFNAICPKDPRMLSERRDEPRFMGLQNRRAQTEGRIATFKNAYLGRPLRSKGFVNKANTTAWCVLTHNLWLIARMALAEELEQQAA